VSSTRPCRHCFFFQAEDGIRDFHVTGVQTCALPIFSSLVIPLQSKAKPLGNTSFAILSTALIASPLLNPLLGSPLIIAEVYILRSEERRVGKESRDKWSQDLTTVIRTKIYNRNYVRS